MMNRTLPFDVCKIREAENGYIGEVYDPRNDTLTSTLLPDIAAVRAYVLAKTNERLDACFGNAGREA
jgi:hypothetical protein